MPTTAAGPARGWPAGTTPRVRDDEPPAEAARLDAFISYRRRPQDVAFVDRLQKALNERGKHVWVDRRNIEPAADWSERIARGIRAAKAFIFVITPESVVSQECLRELDTAAQHHKLVIPVVLGDIIDRRGLPERLSRPNWIFFSPGHDSAHALDEVVMALEVDLEWRDAHTRLAVRAQEWADSQRDRSYLLRGSDLRTAEKRLGKAQLHLDTPPTALQAEYVLASRKAAARTQLTWRTALGTGFVVSLVLAVLAILAAMSANQQRNNALSGQLAVESEQLDATDPVTASLLAAAAWKISPTALARESMLDVFAQPLRAVLDAGGMKGTQTGVAFRPDGKILATAGDDGTARLWNVATHRQIGTPITASSRDSVQGVAFSPDGKLLATAGDDGTARLWNVATHRQIGAPIIASPRGVAFNRSGKILATAGNDGTARLWNVATHRQIGAPIIASPREELNSVAFNRSGKILATAGDDGTARLWNVATHRQIGAPMTAGGSASWAVAFSPDGKVLATGGFDGTARLWNVATHRQIGAPITASATAVMGVAFSPDGQILATIGDDGTARLWNVATYRQIGAPITASSGYGGRGVAFSPDGETLATASDDGTARLWGVAFPGKPLAALCSLTGRSLTHPEWNTYIQSLPYQNVCASDRARVRQQVRIPELRH